MTNLRAWEGVSLPGDFLLEKFLTGDDTAAYFQSSLPPDARPVIVKIIPDSTPQFDLWQRIRQLHHPNLLELLDCGRAALAGDFIVYAVFESPDDTLASALAQAPLTPGESREVLDAALDALRYLHTQGLVLGALDPAHILAVGDRIKFSTDALHEGPPAEDILALGILWQQSLMPASPNSAAIAPHAADPNPQTRWTLDQITIAFNPPQPPPAPAAPPRAPNPVPKWIFIAAAALVLLILGLNFYRPADVVTSPPVFTPSSESRPSVAAPLVPKPSAIPATNEIWRVVAFTYHTQSGAAKKATQINRLHPDLHATVFAPGNKGDYLVVLGDPMSHEDALRLQHSARGKGLPRDIYIQNFTPPNTR